MNAEISMESMRNFFAAKMSGQFKTIQKAILGIIVTAMFLTLGVLFFASLSTNTTITANTQALGVVLTAINWTLTLATGVGLIVTILGFVLAIVVAVGYLQKLERQAS